MTAVLEEVHRATMQNERASALYERLAKPARAAQPAVPAQPAVLARPGVPGRPAVPAQPAVPALPAEKLCVFGVDSWPILTQKPQNHHNQRATWSTKHHGNSLSRLEFCDLEGRPVFLVNLSASTSPRATDEAMCYFNLDMEARTGLRGGLTDKLVGLPGYCVVFLMDNGFRYVNDVSIQ